MISRRTVLQAAAAMSTLAFVPFAHAQEDRVLQVVSQREITSLEPRDTGFHFRRLRVGETLVGITPDGALTPELATGWETSADGLTWRFALREGVTFHDGSEASPQIILEAFERVRPKSELVSKAPISRVYVDGHHLVIELTDAFSLLPAYFTDATQIILSPSSFDADGTVVQVIGTGPYRVVEIADKTSVALEAYPAYWGEQPNIRRVQYTGAVGQDTMLNMAESGQADIVFGVPTVMRDRVESSGRAHLLAVTSGRTFIFRVNAQSPLFNDVRARQALSLAIDRQGIAAAILRNPDAAAYQLFSRALGEWFDPSVAPIARDVDRSKALLAELGWVPGSDGILQRDGERFAFELFAGDLYEMPGLDVALQAQLKEVGMDLEIVTGPWAVMLDAVKAGTFRASYGARNYGQIPDPVATLAGDYPAEPDPNAVWGGVGYSNQDFSQAIAEYQHATSADVKADARQRIQAILQSDLPTIPVGYREYAAAVSDRLDPETVTIDPIEASFWIDRLDWVR